jgi:hypothetical protein
MSYWSSNGLCLYYSIESLLTTHFCKYDMSHKNRFSKLTLAATLDSAKSLCLLSIQWIK